MQTEPKTLWSRPFLTLLVLGVLTQSAYAMVTPTLSEYLQTIGATATVAGLIIGMMAGTALLIRPIAGAVSDRLNRKIIMVVATFLVGISVLGYSFAPNAGLFALCRFVHGSSFAFSTTANMAFSSQLIPTERMGEGVGWLGIGTVLANAVGPSIGLFVGEQLGYPACYQISAALNILAAVLMLTIPYRHTPAELQKFSLDAFFAKDLLLYCFLISIFSFGAGTTVSYLAGLGSARGIANVSVYFMVMFGIVMAVRPLTGKLLDRKGLRFVLLPTYVFGAAAMLLISQAKGLLPILVAACCMAFSQGVGQPAIQSSSIRRLGVARSGVAVSTCYIGQDLANGIAPTVGGWLLEKTDSYAMPFLLCVCLMIMGLAIVTGFALKKKAL